jgi:hypothetical protein
MLATYVPPQLTPVSPENASRAIRAVLSHLMGTPSDRAVAVIHAHQALETWHYKSCWNWGVGNIKSGPKHTGLYTAIPLNERLMRNGKLVYVYFDPVKGELLSKGGAARYPDKPWTLPPAEPQCRMRAYKTLFDAETDKLEKFFQEERWRPAFERAIAGDPEGYVRAIYAKGYFTADPEPYVRSVVSLTATYLPVAIATGVAAPVPEPEPDSDDLCADIAACHRFELPPELAARIRIHQAEHIDDAMARVREDAKRDILEGS